MAEQVDMWICPECGAEVRVGAPGCPRCMKRQRRRAKARTEERKSWEQDDALDGVDLPEEEFDYDEFVAREFGRAPHRKIGIRWWWWATAVLLLVFLTWWWVL